MKVDRQFFHFSGLILIFLFALSSFTMAAVEPDDVALSSQIEQKDLLKQADRLFRQGQLLEAEKLLKSSGRAERDHDVRLRLAMIYIKQQRIATAYEMSFEAAKAEPDNAFAFAVLGTALLSAGRFGEAEMILDNALRLNRKEALAWSGFGLLEFYQNRIDQSLEYLRRAVYYDRSNPDYIFTLAQVAARAEQYAESAEAYRHFLRVAHQADAGRRARIRGLIEFLRYLAVRPKLYIPAGAERTEIDFKLEGNRPIMEVRINGAQETLRFVLDTGSGISVISDETAKRLRIRPVTRGGYAKGIGGDGTFEIVYGFVREISIGDVSISNVPVYIRKFHGSARDIDGYIGLSLVSRFLTTVDYGNLRFTLDRSERGNTAERTATQIPLRLTSSGFLSGAVQLKGVEAPLNFILDTGASVSVISDDVAGLSGMDGYLSERRMRVIGAAGITENVPSFNLPEVSFGEHSRQDILAIALDMNSINEASGFQQGGILGGNFLKNYRVTFDFKNAAVSFVPNEKVP
ncbi:MAG: aspartyl protease family protein [Blastocatellia bacterium]|nr:aspartyl protease family protein [Blastocatellia bacterium]